MTLTDKQICTLYTEAPHYQDPNAYVADMLTSSLLLDLAVPDQESPVELGDGLHTLWHVVNAPFAVLLQRMGLTQTECAMRFCIPLRTVQGWAGETRSAPPYVRLMMAELMGIVNLRRII